MKLKSFWTKAITLLTLVSLGLTCVAGCGTVVEETNDNKASESIRPASLGTLSLASLSADEGIDLGISTYSTMQTGYTLEKSVTATITPASAEGASQGVTWELTWEDGTTTDIANYLKITSGTGSNSLTCYVGCKAAFTKTAILICTTVVGNAKAACSITYTATARSLSADVSKLGSATTDSTWGTSYYKIAAGKTYTVPLKVKDVFGNNLNVDTGVYPITVTAHGSAQYKVWSIYAPNDLKTATPTLRYETNKTAKVDVDFELYKDDTTTCYELLFTCTTDANGNLVIKVNSSFEATSLAYSFLRGEFSQYTDGKPVYFTIQIGLGSSDINTTINVRPFSSVSGVSLSDDAIDFN